MIYVNMERVDEDALITRTGRPYTPNERVSTLFNSAWQFRGWRSVRLAYGVQRGMEGNPEQLQWISVENCTTMIDVFKDTPL
jgi:hypothetical protein